MVFTLYENILQLSTAFLIVLLQRWLLCLSTPQKDWKWFQGTKFYRFFYHIQWYRGIEFYHQYQAKGIIDAL